MSQYKPIEGITPEMLWNTILVLLGICAIVILVYKVIEIARKEHERKELRHTQSGKDLTDVIADKVLEKLAPKFEEIDKKLSADKDRLDNHEASLREIRGSNEIIRDGLKVSCEALTAVLDHELSDGNTEQMEKARNDLREYTNGLIGRVK